MYAIIETAGHQHKVTSGDVLRIDREVTVFRARRVPPRAEY